jgi:signal-transduction protein with cAMP-binding, CBS, and nucleotidyltransferase domain
MITEALSSHEVFSFLQPQQVKAVSDVSEVVSYAEGDAVFRSGEPAVFLYAVLEGRVSLTLPREEGVNLHIEDLETGALFGSCVCFDFNTYTLTATCAADAKLLKIGAEELKSVMEEDPVTGYHVQRMISRTYFTRYLDTMKKLRNIAESLGLRAG